MNHRLTRGDLISHYRRVQDSLPLDWLRDGEWEGAMLRFHDALAECKARTSTRMKANVVDPFNAAAIAAVHGHQEPATLVSNLIGDAIAKCVSNALGRLHQDLLTGANGWQSETGVDVATVPWRNDLRVVAELKNKFNTMNAANRRAVLAELDAARRARPKGTKAYLVHIVPKHPVRSTTKVQPGIVACDGATFYHLVSGRVDALHEVLVGVSMCLSLPSRVSGYLFELGSLPPAETSFAREVERMSMDGNVS